MNDFCPTKIVSLEVQENGIIRTLDGNICARLVDDFEYAQLPETPSKMEVWIVGRSFVDKGWELEGTYTTDTKARAACIEPAMFYSGPLPLDTPFPTETTDFPNLHFPLDICD
jgi:hypothetical protein